MNVYVLLMIDDFEGTFEVAEVDSVHATCESAMDALEVKYRGSNIRWLPDERQWDASFEDLLGRQCQYRIVEEELVGGQLTRPIGPDENHCKKCAAPVRYATVGSGSRTMGVSYDAEQVVGGGYHLTELEDADGVPTGRWGASYTRLAERKAGEIGFRQHDCLPTPQFDNREMAPVMIGGVWTLVHKSKTKGFL